MPMTDNPFVVQYIDEKPVKVETPVGIMAKKLHYRGSRLAVRDVYDLAAVATLRPGDLRHIADAVSIDVLRRALDRVLKMQPEYPKTVKRDVNATEVGVPFLENGSELALVALSTMVDIRTPPSPPQKSEERRVGNEGVRTC